jgi:hypothetical protein
MQPLLQERTSVLHLQNLWPTPLTPKHVLPFHVGHATDIALRVSGKPPRPIGLHWLPPQASLPSTQDHEEYLGNEPDTDEWDDVPYLDLSQEMLADVITEDSPVEVAVDSVWVPSVSYFAGYSRYSEIQPTSFISRPSSV